MSQLTLDGSAEEVASLDLSPTWGGARPGAGRPRTAPETATIAIRVPTKVKQLITARASSQGMTVSAYLAQLIYDCEL